MSAEAMTWAISPPMTPAPTTAALKTNMAASFHARRAAESPARAVMQRAEPTHQMQIACSSPTSIQVSHADSPKPANASTAVTVRARSPSPASEPRIAR